ncbi:MAG: leucine-rich repeat domain-containing protein [Clostridiales bacterium]|nr:MAG: leucine-rich repeat domain-containing protein [Clostridiales bacterium]
MAVKLAINDYAFSGCTALVTLNLPEKPRHARLVRVQGAARSLQW